MSGPRRSEQRRKQFLHSPAMRPLASSFAAGEQSHLSSNRGGRVRPPASENLGYVIIGHVLSGVVGWVDVDQIHLADLLRRLRRIHQMRLGGLSFLCWHFSKEFSS